MPRRAAENACQPLAGGQLAARRRQRRRALDRTGPAAPQKRRSSPGADNASTTEWRQGAEVSGFQPAREKAATAHRQGGRDRCCWPPTRLRRWSPPRPRHAGSGPALAQKEPATPALADIGDRHRAAFQALAVRNRAPADLTHPAPLGKQAIVPGRGLLPADRSSERAIVPQRPYHRSGDRRRDARRRGNLRSSPARWKRRSLRQSPRQTDPLPWPLEGAPPEGASRVENGGGTRPWSKQTSERSPAGSFEVDRDPDRDTYITVG